MTSNEAGATTGGGGQNTAVTAVDPKEPKVIACFQLPYKVTRDSKNPQKFRVRVAIPKHAILYGSLLQIQI